MSEKFIVKTDKGKAKREIVSNFFVALFVYVFGSLLFDDGKVILFCICSILFLQRFTFSYSFIIAKKTIFKWMQKVSPLIYIVVVSFLNITSISIVGKIYLTTCLIVRFVENLKVDLNGGSVLLNYTI